MLTYAGAAADGLLQREVMYSDDLDHNFLTTIERACQVSIKALLFLY